jgi:transposase
MSGLASKDRYRVSDALWARIFPLLPRHRNTHRFGGGRPRVEDRKAMDAILFVLRTGCQWNALNATGICSSSTAHARFQEWSEAGVFLKLWKRGLQEYEELHGIDWAWQSMDGAMSKAPLGGGKNRAQPHRPGQGRGQAKRPV